MVRNPPKGKLEPVLQRERNCNYYDRSSIAEKEKLQLLRPLQYCKQQETAAITPAWQRGKLQLTTTTAPVLQRDTCTGTPRSYRYIVSGMTPWIVEGPESHTRALTPPHASVYRRVCVGSNPPSQPAPRPPRFIGLRFACGGGFVSGFFQGGLGHMHVPRSPNFRGNRA